MMKVVADAIWYCVRDARSRGIQTFGWYLVAFIDQSSISLFKLQRVKAISYNPAWFLKLAYLTERTVQMPPTLHSGADLSLRHLPDVSDASFSFQIPTTLSKGDLLLGDNDADFLQNVDDSMLASPKTTDLPLTLAELTPRRNIENDFGTGMSTRPLLRQKDYAKPTKIPQSSKKVARSRPSTTNAESTSSHKIMLALVGEASPAAAKLRALKSEVEMLNEDLQLGVNDVTPHIEVGDTREQPQGSKLPKVIMKRKQVRSPSVWSEGFLPLNEL
jgi:hypothetical protein